MKAIEREYNQIGREVAQLEERATFGQLMPLSDLDKLKVETWRDLLSRENDMCESAARALYVQRNREAKSGVKGVLKATFKSMANGYHLLPQPWERKVVLGVKEKMVKEYKTKIEAAAKPQAAPKP